MRVEARIRQMREQGFGMGVTHWHAGRICAADSSADRKAVRIAKGYLRFITEGCRAGARAGMRRDGIAGFAAQRGRSGLDPGAPGPAPLNAA